MKVQIVFRILIVTALIHQQTIEMSAQVGWEVGKLSVHEAYEVTTQPSFPGGDGAMNTYIQHNMRYPDRAKQNDIQGKVWVEFTVSSEGHISDSRILRGIGSGCDEEVMRIIDSMPCWQPAAIDGYPVATRYVIPVVFELTPS